MKRTIVIGDVHGCSAELSELLAKCAITPSDRIVLVGDMVAKGPDSAGVIDLAIAHKMLAVRGNHDEAILNWRRARDGGHELPRLSKTGIATAETLSFKHIDWLESLPYTLDLGDGIVVVHAGFIPGVARDKQTVQTMIRIRSFDEHDAPTDKVLGSPWATKWQGPEFVIFGHDAIRGLQQAPFALGLDTGCCYGNELTACILPTRELVSVKAHRIYTEIPR